ncbi:hypothetical protein AVEN_122666-1 [Araneus ventricosus]|nr:hypothetical protein AVEN_122666-1 [Araneus ventricosus]
MTFLNIKDLIIKSASYDANFCKSCLTFIISERKAEETLQRDQLEKERSFELEKLKIQAEQSSIGSIKSSDDICPSFDLQRMLIQFEKDGDMALYLTLCERQFKILKVPPDLWVTYLISSLPAEIGRLLAREPEIKIHDFEYVKTLLLQRFKMNAVKYRILFSPHKKAPESTWKDFAFELQSCFQSWLDELEIKTLEDLKALIISGQMKKRTNPVNGIGCADFGATHSIAGKEITPYLKRFSELSSEIRDKIEKKQDRRKKQFGRRRRPLYFSPGDKVWVTTHPVSKAHSKITAKFVPKRDGPYLILTQKSPTTYIVSRLDSPNGPLGTYHVSALHPVQSRDTQPVSPIKKRGRPPKTRTTCWSTIIC